MVSTSKYDVAIRGITFAPEALGVPRGGGFRSKNAKQQGAAFLELAERGGFEPPEPIRVQRFSSPPRSTAPASLRSFRGQGLWFGSEA